MPEVDKPTISCDAGQFSPDNANCNAFYQCVLGELKKQYCAGGLHWNREKSICDWPSEAKCEATKRMFLIIHIYIYCINSLSFEDFSSAT